MSAQTLLVSLFEYKAWADQGLIAGLSRLDKLSSEAGYRTAVGIFNHAQIVDRIFGANLQCEKHAYRRTDSDDVPNLEDLSNAIRDMDRWYIQYVTHLRDADLTEAIAFSFTDGTAGRMSREEMLGHVIAHGGYHRGEIGQILTQLTGSSPRDTFTGFLHEVEPARSR
ncbi:DinB family protein [Paraburkholderia sediminicola]|uniref:DinB family protein n=1 Tax=Paraburkholderia sediminicola TaxID=458836 RepID=UPI0038B6E405